MCKSTVKINITLIIELSVQTGNYSQILCQICLLLRGSKEFPLTRAQGDYFVAKYRIWLSEKPNPLHVILQLEMVNLKQGCVYYEGTINS